MRNTFSCFLLVLCFTGCKTSNENVVSEDTGTYREPVYIDLTTVKESNSPLKLSDFAKSITYIALDENPLIGDIKHTRIYCIEDTFYLDGNQVYKYTPEGIFIKELFKIGQGPGEARKVTNAAFNAPEKYLTFKNYYGKYYNSYSFDGQLIREESATDSIYKRINTYFNGYQIFTYALTGKGYKKGDRVNALGPYLFYARDIQTDTIVYKYPNPSAKELATFSGGYAELSNELQFISTDSLLWFKHIAIDTLYVTSDMKNIYPRYIFQTNEHFIDIIHYMRTTVMDMTKAEFEKKTKSVHGVLPLPNGGLVYMINNGIGIADPTGKTSNFSEKPIINDLDEYLSSIDLNYQIQINKFTISNGYLYMLIDAFNFFEEGNSSPFPNLTEESNPVIARIKLME